MHQFKVNHLNIRIKGRSPRLVQTAIAGLGYQICYQIDRQRNLQIPRGKRNINRINIAPIRIFPGTTSTELSKRIAGEVVKTITKHTRER